MVKIIADTLSSITVAEAAELGIDLLPQIVIFGDTSYKDDTEIDQEMFIQRLTELSTLPRTTAPYPSLYEPILKRLSDKKNDILIICPSSKMSGTYSRAMVAAQDFPHANITAIDTLALGAGLGTLVRQAVKWALEGMDMLTIADRVIEMSKKNRTYFLVETLEYLQKGGRIGTAKALVGSLLQVKPLLGIVDGQVSAIESQRTHKKALQCFIERIENECPKNNGAFLNIQHGGAMGQAQEIAAILSERMGFNQIPISQLPSAILTHGGPGVLGASFFVS